MAKLLLVFALLCLAAVLTHGEEVGKPHHLGNPHGIEKRSDSGWYKNHPNSPTERKTLKDSVGQQIDYTHNTITGHRTSGYLALGKTNRQSDSPPRTASHTHSGGQPSTSQKKPKGKGH